VLACAVILTSRIEARGEAEDTTGTHQPKRQTTYSLNIHKTSENFRPL